MKSQLLTLFLLALGVARLQAQPTITAGDMFNEPGLYYRAYANVAYDPLDPSTTTVPASELIGHAGGGNFWDFTSGPTNQVYRFDYLSAASSPYAADFPGATLAERKTVEGTGQEEWLMFTQQPQGRRVFGFVSDAFNPGAPLNIFTQSILDFPSAINAGNTWSTVATIYTELTIIDDIDGEFSIPLRLTLTSTFVADAWGIIDLPGLGFGDALRINEVQKVYIEADLDGTGDYMELETDMVRQYYWLRPGKGIVAQLLSTQVSGLEPPPEQFAEAASFVRMFETNKKASSGGTEPTPIDDLNVSVNLDEGRALLKWTKGANTTSYRVEYQEGPLGTGGWTELGTTSDAFMLDTTLAGTEMRFYRIVSIK